jgi:hypothetical protein
LPAQVSIYPNPAINGQEVIIANLPESVTNVLISDAKGSTIADKKIKVENGQATLDLSDIEPGIYLLKADNKMHKLIIKGSL